ncbi:MAG: type II toxin-antitoxin system RatA family toxin [Gammaproteobacteria bacterium]|nr:type II toxin-antitoxin system RatA family toxin [Gammaproteobacteria bacterium]
MTTIEKSALVPHSAQQMYALVDDIASYPDFLPWCKSTEILMRNEDEVRASVEISQGVLHKSFTTHNRMQQSKMIEMRLVEGPFSHLEGFWRFEVLGEQACKVRLDMDFEFSNKLIGMAMGPVFSKISNTLVDAFCQRAAQVYSNV